MTPDMVIMELVFDNFGERCVKVIEFNFYHVKNKTSAQILGTFDFYIETKELREQYLQSIQTYKPLIKQIGIQFYADGFCYTGEPDTYYRYGKKLETVNHKVIIDALHETDERYDSSSVVTTGETFWKQQHKKFKETNNPLISPVSKIIEIPIHPILVIFDLRRHMRLTIHAEYLTLYEYDENLAEKLVLTESSKSLVDILIQYKEGGFRDIVQGKSGGVITLLAGPAGVGKTLTAEVFAESRKKPLYTIHASQLGVSPIALKLFSNNTSTTPLANGLSAETKT